MSFDPEIPDLPLPAPVASAPPAPVPSAPAPAEEEDNINDDSGEPEWNGIHAAIEAFLRYR